MQLNLNSTRKLFTFFTLYIAQSIPMSFFSTVLPVIMRQQNYSLEEIGMLQLLKLPWILKFFWSPIVDISSNKLTHYKRWIFTSEFVYAAIILSVTFFDFKADMAMIIPLIFLAFVASATQDIATDALAVLSFNKKDKSLVNSMQSVGSFMGAMLGGGVLLLLFNKLGWNNLLPFLALFVIIALIPLLFFKDKDVVEEIIPQSIKTTKAKDLIGFFLQKGIWKQIIFLFLYYAGLIGILAMLKPLLVDYGYSIKQIGIMSGIIGTSIGCVGSLAGGFIVRRVGRFWPRIVFAVMTLLTGVYFYMLVTCLQVNTATLHLGITMLWFSYGLATIVVYTTAMDCVRKGFEGSDFTLQTVITHLSGIIMAIGAGKLADKAGYDTLFVVEVVIAAISLTFILLAFRKEKQNETGIDK